MSSIIRWACGKNALGLSTAIRHLSRSTSRPYMRTNHYINSARKKAIPIAVGIGGTAIIGGILFGAVGAESEQLKTIPVHVPKENKVFNDLSGVIADCQRLVQIKKEEVGLPAIVIGVSVNGQLVWQEGFGYSDVENLTPCHADTVMRIASISKCIAMAIAARLMDEGKLDIDSPIQKYIPKFPVKTVNGEKVIITTRQLMCHLGGIRHYEKNCTKASISDGDMEEFYIKEEYKTVSDAMNIFMKDDLEHKPGEKFLYTTHGWTVISAVLEGAAGQEFPKLVEQTFRELGMSHSYLGYHKPVIANHARYYHRTDKNKLENSPYVDLSCKWAGGGMLSTVKDLCSFGSTLLSSYQSSASQESYIKPATMKEMWTINSGTEGKARWLPNGGYGLGWGIDEGNLDKRKGVMQPFTVSHTGGACGASSVITILPNADGQNNQSCSGVVVSMMTNLQSVGLGKLSIEIAERFLPLSSDK